MEISNCCILLWMCDLTACYEVMLIQTGFEPSTPVFQVVVGDLDGLLQVFSIKKGEVVNIFRSMPCKTITCITLGGALGKLTYNYITRDLF